MATKNGLIAWFGARASEANAEPEVPFEEVYRAELPRIYNYFRYRVGDGPLAEDLTSETFEKAWRNRWRYRRELAAFSTWLFTIARRVGQDHYRKKHDDLPLDRVSEPLTSENLEDLIEQHADFAQLSVLLARLADRERELVALKYGAGLTNRAIARLSGLSESNVGVILHRAVQTLRSEWEGNP
jgi:RNA polymerase sigma-70 factor (ECF subfamily)